MNKVPIDKDGHRILTKEQRRRVYERALKTFKKHVETVIEEKRGQCNGMCVHVDRAVSYLGYDRYWPVKRSYSRKAWPEYKSFEPKAGWKKNTSFWLTRNVKANGHTKRIAILTALAEGKSKGE